MPQWALQTVQDTTPSVLYSTTLSLDKDKTPPQKKLLTEKKIIEETSRMLLTTS